MTFETWKEAETREKSSCSFCGASSDIGYHFVCHMCGATYCYIHMNKHAKAHRQHVLSYASSTMSDKREVAPKEDTIAKSPARYF
jgi:hypothetical protein